MAVIFIVCVGLLAYTFAGYPAAVALLARLRPQRLRVDPTYEPPVTLVIAAYNEADVILERLANAAELDYPQLEVVVVADGSDDATADLARTVPGTVVLHDPVRKGKLAALHRGTQVATGDVFVFSDANNRYSPTALRHLVAPFADPSVGVVTGRKAIECGTGRCLDDAEGLYWRYESRIREWESAIGGVTGVAGEILAFRREAYRRPAAGTMNEDFVQAMLAATDGWRVVYAPGAVSTERASATLEDEETRRTRLVTGRLQALRGLAPRLARHPRLAWQVVSHKGLRPTVPVALILAAATNVGAARSHRWARAALGPHVLFYAAALAGWRDARNGRRNLASYLPYYFCRMNLASVRGVRDFARGRKEAVWAKVQRG